MQKYVACNRHVYMMVWWRSNLVGVAVIVVDDDDGAHPGKSWVEVGEEEENNNL